MHIKLYDIINNKKVMFELEEPTSWDELKYQRDAKQKAEKWMKTFIAGEMSKALCIVSPYSIGKTVFTKLLLEKFDFKYKISACNSERNASTFANDFNTILSNSSLLYYFDKTKVGIIIDELETIDQLDKSIMQTISTYIPKMRKNPIILIATDKKYFKKILKNVEIITLKPLDLNYSILFIQNQLKKYDRDVDISKIKDLCNIYKENITYKDIESIVNSLILRNNTVDIRDHLYSCNTKEETFLSLCSEYQKLDIDNKLQLYLYDSKYMIQVIFENSLPFMKESTESNFLLSRKIEYLLHNSQFWNIQPYMEYFDVSEMNTCNLWNNIETVPKVYSKISQYLYQKKTVENISEYFNINSATSELLSYTLLNLHFEKKGLLEIPHKMKNNLKRVSLDKEKWKNVLKEAKKLNKKNKKNSIIKA